MNIALYTHEDCLKHEKPGHPERPDRLAAVRAHLGETGLADELETVIASPASAEDVALVHPAHYYTHVIDAEPSEGNIQLDVDTYMSAGSSRAGLLAAGAVTEATRRVLAGDVDRAFCATRPPGHHAELASALGFCLFNSVAIAAETRVVCLELPPD